MTDKPTCCVGLPQHTYTAECLLRREDAFDIGTEDGRHALARKIAEDWRESGGVLHPGVSYVHLEPGEHVLSGEDIRRLLGEESP